MFVPPPDSVGVDFTAAMLGAAEATSAALDGFDVDHVCVSISTTSLPSCASVFRYSASEARRLGRVDQIAKLARAAGRSRRGSGVNPWVVVATSPVFVFADMSVAWEDDVEDALHRGGDASAVPLSHGAPSQAFHAGVGSWQDGRGRFLEALAAQGRNTFQVHSTIK